MKDLIVNLLILGALLICYFLDPVKYLFKENADERDKDDSE